MSDAASDGWAGMPPGPGLGARLAVIDPHDVPDEQLGELLVAQDRQLSYQQAQKWKVMAEMGRRDPMPNLPGGARWSPSEVFENAIHEIRAELMLTRRSAEAELVNAHRVAELAPVMQALLAGEIDRARAIRFAEGCTDLTAEQTAVLLADLLPVAATVTATELAEKIKRAAMALDPEWACRRYTQAIKERKVIAYLNQDGSAVISGQNLPAEEAAAAIARVAALADAAKRAGVKARIDLLRSVVFTGLLDGRFHYMSQEAIIADLQRQFRKPTPGSEPADKPTPKAAATAPADAGQDAAAIGRGVHLRVGLATLLGVQDQPGQIAGMGTIPADAARAIAVRQRRSEWRYAILDQDGRLLFDGITRRRPRHPRLRPRPGGGRPVRGGIVELHVPLALLTDPTIAGQHPEWAGLLADLAAQYAEQAPIEQDPTARFAGRPLRRRQQTRYQRCIFPGCRRPASECDLDHRHEHADGGQTDEQNTGPGCRHDHELKTSHGWRLVRRDQNTYVWISPLGRKHVVQIDPVAPPLRKPTPRLLPPEIDYPDLDDPDPPPTFQALDRRARPLVSVIEEPVAVIIDSTADPPPF